MALALAMAVWPVVADWWTRRAMGYTSRSSKIHLNRLFRWYTIKLSSSESGCSCLSPSLGGLHKQSKWTERRERHNNNTLRQETSKTVGIPYIVLWTHTCTMNHLNHLRRESFVDVECHAMPAASLACPVYRIGRGRDGISLYQNDMLIELLSSILFHLYTPAWTLFLPSSPIRPRCWPLSLCFQCPLLECTGLAARSLAGWSSQMEWNIPPACNATMMEYICNTYNTIMRQQAPTSRSSRTIQRQTLPRAGLLSIAHRVVEGATLQEEGTQLQEQHSVLPSGDHC